MKILIPNSNKYEINTATGEITNSLNQKNIALQLDGTFMILENKKLLKYKVIYKDGKYEVFESKINLGIENTKIKNNNFKCISYNEKSGKYICKFCRKKQVYYLGFFDTRDQALDAKKKKLEELNDN